MPIFCLGGGRGHPLSALKVNDFTLKKERKKLPWKTSSVSVVAGRVWTGTGRGTVFHPQMFSRPGLNWRYMKQGIVEHFFCNWSSNISWIISEFTFPFCDMAKGETFGEGGRIFNIELLLNWEGSSQIPQPTFWEWGGQAILSMKLDLCVSIAFLHSHTKKTVEHFLLDCKL